MLLAKLHTVRCQDRPGGIAIIINENDRAGMRDHSSELVIAAHRRKRAGETAAILFVDSHRERDRVEPRLGRGGRGMMRIARPEHDGLAVAFPGAAKVEYRA